MQKAEITNSVEETFGLGKRFGQSLKGGEVIEFVGDLGAGKTSFMRGLAEGVESQDSVSSPTFTLSNVYAGRDGIQIYHFDLYRLSEPGLVAEQLQEVIDDPKTIVCVEWAESVRGILPENTITIQIVPIDENTREFLFNQ
ncbi:MAG TPA: tRNA (adenosine(37)-N6)-threonylcarbamoyltransferase complex ATPase subunit type 1 TsaE [Candidatus Saccharimonadales bacterium]|nr:tRNA (adenosine(37)-N6)-threonylcarbamoyltransferase complex ATPase subunit type 1 TsaE [Candidatus Saccharimonadales bacterium]